MFKEELMEQKESLKRGIELEKQIKTESFYFLIKSRIKKEILKNLNQEKVIISFIPLNRENYQEMFMLDIDISYLAELCQKDGINFYVDWVADKVMKWETYFFEVSLKPEKSLVLAK